MAAPHPQRTKTMAERDTCELSFANLATDVPSDGRASNGTHTAPSGED